MGKPLPEVPGWSKLGHRQLEWEELEQLVNEIEAPLSPPPDGTLESAIDPGEKRPDFQRLIDDFYACALEALRSLTEPEAFVFALDLEYDGYLFWPHRAVAGEPWPLRVPGPEAFDSLYAPREYAWGFYIGWYYVEVFGQSLLDAFESLKPELLSKVVAVDGVELPASPLTELEQRRLEHGTQLRRLP